MSINRSLVNYSNTWDIDQLIAQGDATISGAGNTTVATLPSSAILNVFEVLFQPSGSSKWYRVGSNSTAATLATKFVCYSYIQGTSLILNTTSAGSARYYVWADKVDN